MWRIALSIAVSVGLLAVGVAGYGQGRRDPVLYGLASFFLPGLGQYLNGEPDKAIVHFLVAVSIPTVGYYLASITRSPVLERTIPLLQFGWSVYSALDAYRTAKRYNELHGFTLGPLAGGV